MVPFGNPLRLIDSPRSRTAACRVDMTHIAVDDLRGEIAHARNVAVIVVVVGVVHEHRRLAGKHVVGMDPLDGEVVDCQRRLVGAVDSDMDWIAAGDAGQGRAWAQVACGDPR